MRRGLWRLLRAQEAPREGPGCAVYAGRLLPQTRRLDVPEHARRRPWHLRLPVVRLQQQGEQAVRFGAEGKRLRRPCTGHTKAPTSPLAQAMEMSRLHEPLQIYLGPTRHVKREMICWAVASQLIIDS
ncbi:uncharacterized protein LOC104585306 [Brachypodium distachyon]|uniref:uncharacterized protein LOC104585306 n=1 Tax=Brachypodium distachyon TaxID=15368 RepID=UPI00052FDD97|nr:uncharacterized protein LOC104585306 [Brachypodium distachyon]|eukprot:XP_010239781.1 uncharacterized protein LOC104585306 [Brachypodium distachyon]